MPRRGFFNLLAVSVLALLSPRPAVAPANGVMADDAFWAIVEGTAVHEANTDQQTRALFAALSRLSAADVVAFNAAFERKMAEAYRTYGRSTTSPMAARPTTASSISAAG
jgi:uncharacterized protein with PIN domain